jgi:hypothetical protein
MCGPTAGETAAATQESGLGSTLTASFAKNFGAQSDILSNLTNVLTPIAQAGPDQQGFGTQELAALNTQANQGIGQNYNKAAQALQGNLAARGGGNEVLPTGAEASLKGELASSAANQMSNAGLAITNANYAQGRQNWQAATSQLENVGQMENPLGFAGAASGATQAGYSMQSANSNMAAQQFGEIAGGISGLVGAGMGIATGMPGLGGGGGTPGGPVWNPTGGPSTEYQPPIR